MALSSGPKVAGGVWPAIQQVAMSGGPYRYAVAYVTSQEVVDHLGDGDILVCNGSDATLATGGTDPKVLRSLLKRGVSVWSNQRLHAKIYVSRALAFVGSANASANALPTKTGKADRTLLEAGYLADTRAEVGELRKFVLELAKPLSSTRVDEAWLNKADQVWHPSSGGGGARLASGALSLHFERYGDAVPARIEAAATKQEKEVKALAGVTSDHIDWSWSSARSWKVGQRVAWVERNGRNQAQWWCQAPAECFTIRPTGIGGFFAWWSYASNRELPWGEVQRHVAAVTGADIALDTYVRRADVISAIYDLLS